MFIFLKLPFIFKIFAQQLMKIGKIFRHEFSF
jgi:hypothetical protein